MMRCIAYLLLLFPFTLHAADFEIDSIAYNILESELYDMTAPIVEVTSRDDGPYEGDVTVPTTVTWEGIEYKVFGIGYEAFANNDKLFHVTLPEGLNYIDDWAFFGCEELYFPKLPSSLELIGNYAFSNCKYNTHVVRIPESVKSLGECAFIMCLELDSIFFPASIKKIPKGCCSACLYLRHAYIPEGITEIGEYAFEGCDTRFHEVTLPHSMEIIGDGAFKAHKLHGIKMYDGITSIGNGTFDECVFLNFINIPKSITTIGYETFHRCESLTSIDIPSNIATIKQFAFANCSSVSQVYIRGDNTYLSKESFAVDTTITDFYCYGNEMVEAHPMAFSRILNERLVINNSGDTTYVYTAMPDSEYIDMVTLHVPADLMHKYKKAEPWCNFGKIVALDGDENKVGDINHDGNIDTQDVLLIYDEMRMLTNKYIFPDGLDINKDKVLDMKDVQELYDIMSVE